MHAEVGAGSAQVDGELGDGGVPRPRDPGNAADLLQTAGFDCRLGKKAERRRLRQQRAAAERQGAKVVSAAVKVV
jgi:hypothetical protein